MTRLRLVAWATVGTCGALTSALSLAAPVAPFSFDSAYGRLPKNIVPIDYSIAVVPDAAARTLTGDETIALRFREATATIVFNSLNESLSDVRLGGTAALGRMC